jgi:hypothetical protein
MDRRKMSRYTARLADFAQKQQAFAVDCKANRELVHPETPTHAARTFLGSALRRTLEQLTDD